jgi:hypothetical protein
MCVMPSAMGAAITEPTVDDSWSRELTATSDPPGGTTRGTTADFATP